MELFQLVLNAAWMAFTMFWQIFWGLSLGFLFSAGVEIVVSRSEMARLLPDASPRTLTIAAFLGAASSSCSYAAVAMARSIIRKGGNLTSAMAFQFAATNLVLEIGVLMWVLIGWPFAAAEFVGGPLMIIALALLFKFFLRPALQREAIKQADKGIAGSMEGHAAMTMEAQSGTWQQRIRSRQGWIAISHNFVMTWSMLWRDILIGLIIAGILAAWVPNSFWNRFFLTDHRDVAVIWGAFVGPLIAIASFTCSVGNVPLAAELWKGGLSFGGVSAFIFGDLIILPILGIYRKYYGGKMTVFIAITFYIAMVAAALIIEFLFRALGWTPSQRVSTIVDASIHWNYTTFLDIALGLVSLALFVIFARTGGPEMMRMMGSGNHHHSHHHSHRHAAHSSSHARERQVDSNNPNEH